jgi:DNA-binding CsgD family transcriptional regulator
MTAHVTENQMRTALLDSHRRVLERIASGAPLRETFETLIRLIEEQADGMRCAILLTDPSEQRLRLIAAPNIPEDYKSCMEPFQRIAPGMGPCGVAAYLRKPVYTKDIATDPLRKDCRDIALRNGLRAIWSTPILADDNSVLGTFTMFYGEPRLPSLEHIQLIDMATQMVRVAIEAKRGENALRQSEAFLAEARRFGRLIARAAGGQALDDTSGNQSAEAVRLPGGPGRYQGEDLARGIQPRSHAPVDAGKAMESLTAKERGILRLVAEGRSNTEIGQILHLSPRTVETYRHRLMQKLNIANLPMLVKFAIRHGITKVE